MLELIGECVAQGFSRLELCGKDADWTRRWTTQSRPIAAVRLYPPTLRGVTGMVRDVGGLGLRLARARLARKVE